MSSSIQIRAMTEKDIDLIFKGFSGHDISKPLDYVKRCWDENQRFDRVTLLAFYDATFVGWGHVIHKPLYPYFAENGIPEIQNFDIIPPFRKRGIGSVLIDSLEEIAFNKSNTIGIGFGLYADYGTAQRMYIKRGYIPDGRGMMYNNMPVVPGGQIRIDDDLVLFLTKSKMK